MNNDIAIYKAINELKADLNNTGCKQHLKYLKVDFNGNYLTSRVRNSTTSCLKFVCFVVEFNQYVEKLKLTNN